MRKWTSWIVGILVVGLIVFFLARPGGLLNPNANAHLVMTVIDFPQAVPGTIATVTIEVTNDGDAVADPCQAYWGFENETLPTVPAAFKLAAGESTDITLAVMLRGDFAPGDYPSTLSLECNNADRVEQQEVLVVIGPSGMADRPTLKSCNDSGVDVYLPVLQGPAEARHASRATVDCILDAHAAHEAREAEFILVGAEEGARAIVQTLSDGTANYYVQTAAGAWEIHEGCDVLDASWFFSVAECAVQAS